MAEKNLVCEFPASQRQALIDKNHPELSISEQARLLSINRTSLYYKPLPPDKKDLEIKRHIDKIYTAYPEFGSRRICAWLKRYDEIHLNHKTIQRHMREMGIQAIYPHQNTSKPSKDNPIYPNMHIVTNNELDVEFSFILSATMFNGLMYEIDTIYNVLNINIPDNDSMVQNLRIKNRNGKWYVLCESDFNNKYTYV